MLHEYMFVSLPLHKPWSEIFDIVIFRFVCQQLLTTVLTSWDTVSLTYSYNMLFRVLLHTELGYFKFNEV